MQLPEACVSPYQPANLMRKTFLGNSKKNMYFSQMSAVRTGVRTYMDATPLE